MKRRFLVSYWKQCRWILFALLAFLLTFFTTYILYQLPFEALIYQLIVCTVILGVCFGIDMRRAYQKYQQFLFLEQLPAEMLQELPTIQTIEDEHYQKILRLLQKNASTTEEKLQLKYQDMMDYYTTWVHQIKTPIAAMKLQLQNEDNDNARRLSEELLRIEQYVEMVLMYLRLDAETSDYVFKTYELDDMIKPVVRKFARQFIRRKLSLTYQPLEIQVLTDEKWLSFVIEQVLTNALKYTSQGGITIKMEEPQILCICDTGMGIAAGNLPRIFEKGYTGYNGRNDKSASGIGLYLCKRICNQLGHRIWAESQIDEGTTIKIDLAREQLEVE